MVPYVIGAAIDLGNCLDLTVRDDVELLRGAYQGLVASLREEGRPVPRNRDVAGDPSRDKLLRNLDCAVIRYLHDSIERQSSMEGAPDASDQTEMLERFDTVRGLFREGDPIYPGSGFYERTQTQIAVRSPACIKGIFIPRPLAR